DNPCQDRPVGAKWSPARQVACSLSADALARICWRAGEGRRRHAGRTIAARTTASRRGARRRPIDNRVDVAIQNVVDEVKRVVGEIPAGIGQGIVQRTLVGHAKTATQCHLAVAHYIISKTETWAEIVVVAFAETLCGGESA